MIIPHSNNKEPLEIKMQVSGILELSGNRKYVVVTAINRHGLPFEIGFLMGDEMAKNFNHQFQVAKIKLVFE